MNRVDHAHPWIQSLQQALDELESELLANNAPGVELASSRVQTILQQAPRTSELHRPGSLLLPQMEAAARRFGRLRQAVIQSAARSQRAVESLLPQTASPTYGPRGADTGRGYHLSA
jgi:hypothetical protein